MARKLKVYRTPIGFHDAYVAAPSQKAALEAWGSDANLFTRGIAEIVTDEELTLEPLEHPGKVIKRLRGSAAEQLAALPPDRPKKRKTESATAEEGKSPKDERAKPETRGAPRPKPKPRPSRAALDQAEQKLDKLSQQMEAEEQALRARERAIAKERRDLETKHKRDYREAERAVDKEREAHSEALARWIEEQG
jgi:hypothetical protein